jgi:glycerophosphoryl diester phosphodiesterase
MRRALRAERVLRIGHRGAASLAPENTLASIDAALEHGLDMVEIDLTRSPSGALVVAHDPASITSDSPSLGEALSHLREHAPDSTTIQLDLKVGDAAGDVLEALESLELVERTLVCALHAGWLVELGRREPDLMVGLSYPRDRAGIGERPRFQPIVRIGTNILAGILPYRVLGMARRAGADVLSLHHTVISPGTIERCAQAGLPVLAWTVDDVATASALARAGVRGIVSNDPGVLDAI